MNKTKEIQDYLRRLEVEHNIQILYAVESGSRAWGYSSDDSDYDIRFIYLHPLDYYLRIDKPRDVIEHHEEDMDVVGWDLKKAMHLLWKSNPSMYDWLQSPTVYRESAEIRQIRDVAYETYSPVPAFFHYLELLRSTYTRYLSRKKVEIKRYMYAIRPAMALEYLRTYNRQPPVNIYTMKAALSLSGDVSDAINDLINQKRNGFEREIVPRIKVLDDYIQYERDLALERKKDVPSMSPKNHVRRKVAINNLFSRIVQTRNERWKEASNGSD